MSKSDSHLSYIGDELHVFKNAVNWKNYFSYKLKSFIKGKVLEVGAGIGSNTNYFLNHNKEVTSWSMVEPDVNLASQIKENQSKFNHYDINVINGTIENVQNETFDTILYIDVLEHIEDAKSEIQLARKVLNPGGRLIILVPAYDFLFSDFDKAIGHYRRYNKQMLLSQINGTLDKEKLFYLDSTGFFASLANKLILQKSIPSQKEVCFWDRFLVRLSYVSDIVFFNAFGKSLIGVFKRL
ncbi:class I SAM-dependent methyltransferase [Reichenbachiella sp.]|uniref:class I SAM-dependent methyltransferase n=1 Tax=Reichenbachiella sp. TaxID=2184521 RepID=UPI003BB1A411